MLTLGNLPHKFHIYLICTMFYFKYSFFSIQREFVYGPIYDNNITKILGLIYAITVSAIITPLVYLVTQFERQNPLRLLLSQLFSKILLTGILFVIIVEVPNYFIYIVGPLPEFMCNIELVLRGALTISILILLNAILIARYIFLFHTKNPTATQHDYWTHFLSIWSLCVGIITNLVFLLMPGKNPNYFYICLGKIPDNHEMTKPKQNLPLLLTILVTVCLHIVFGVKLKMSERKESNEVTLNNSAVKSKSKINDVVSLSLHLAGLIVYMIIYFPAFKIQAIDPRSFNEYPNFVWMYVFHLGSVQTFEVLLLTSLLGKNEKLYKFVKRSILLSMHKQ